MQLNTATPLPTVVARLEELIPSLMEKAGVPGLSIALIRESEIAWCRGFGVRSVETNEPVTADTIFEAASLSKPVFAYAALKLVEEGILNLDTPLTEYLSEPYIPDEPRLQQISMRVVLSHTTGFPNWRPKGEALRIHFDPGSRFSYSGEGYEYLQKVVETTTGRKGSEFMQDRLLKPLGMTNSSFTWSGGNKSSIAQGHNGQREPYEKRLWPEMSAAGSLHSTPSDYARFIVAMMNRSEEDGIHLRPETIDLMLTPQVKVNDSSSNHEDWPSPEITLDKSVSWGLGWGIQHHPDTDSFWQWGSNEGFKAFAVGFRDMGVGLVVMSNSDGTSQIWGDLLTEAIGGDHPALSWLERI